MGDLQYDNLKKAMDKYGSELIIELATQLKNADSVATGKLIRSLDYELLEVLNTIVVNIRANDYLTYVDSGRRPGKRPPVEAIRKWVDAKRLPQWTDKAGRPYTKQGQAFIIARSIGNKGIKPTNVISKAITKVRRLQNELIAEAATKDIIGLIKNVLVNV